MANGFREEGAKENIYDPCRDPQSGEWRRLRNDELQKLIKRPCIPKEITKRRLSRAGYFQRKREIMIRTVTEEEPIEKRPVGRPLSRENCVKRDVEAVNPRTNWKEVAEDRGI